MAKTFYKVQCTNATHRLCVMGSPSSDADFSSSDTACTHALDERLTKLGGLARLGAPIEDIKGCLGLALLVKYGLPSIFGSGGVGEELRLGHWRQLYIRYESHSLVTNTISALRRAAHEQYADLFALARLDLLRLRQAYRVDLPRNELRSTTRFVPETPSWQLNGFVVADYSADRWTVPLQRGWEQSVHAAGLSVIADHFVVGVSEETPGIVFAITNENGRYVVREFFYNHHTRQLGAIKPEPALAVAPAPAPTPSTP